MLTKLHARARAVLTSTRGDMTTESITGAVIVTLITVAALSLFITMLTSSQAAATNTSRSATLSAEVAAHTPALDTLLARDEPLRVDAPDAPGGPSTIWVWAEQDGDLQATIHAAMPRLSRHADAATECVTATGAGTGRTFETKPGCLKQSLSVTQDLAGVDGNVVVVDGQETYLHTTVAPETDELRYVVHVTATSGANPAVVIAYTTATGDHTHRIPATETGYYYGGLDVTAVSELHIEPSGVDIDQVRSMIYEAP